MGPRFGVGHDYSNNQHFSSSPMKGWKKKKRPIYQF
uniref:Uncharacterized protein n=1 Tax=Rhizophora mucronata TaxID=61149 RepID=A0A2P2P689_RHIMU